MTRSDPLCFYRAGIQLLVETRGPVFRFSSLPRHWRRLVAGNSRNSKHWSKNKMIEPQCQLNVIHFQFSEVYVFTTFPSPWVSYGFGFPAAKLSVGSSVGWWCCCSARHESAVCVIFIPDYFTFNLWSAARFLAAEVIRKLRWIVRWRGPGPDTQPEDSRGE